ncbi:unnamed protein product [Ixodes hexagonus]
MEKDIEEYRQPWESNEHWELRKEFLLAHAGKFDENRLLCLAQAFANVELLGCAYPKDVMIQISELAKDVTSLTNVQEKRKENSKVLFVKGEDDKSKARGHNELGTYTRHSNTPRGNFRGGYGGRQQQHYQGDGRMGAASFFQR